MSTAKVFRNPGRTLAYAPPAPFATISDVRVEPLPTEGFGTHMVWTSIREGVIATFPWWDNVQTDERLESRDWWPVGSAAEPYVDADQDWTFQCWADDEWVYVVEGLDFTSWERRYRVPRHAFELAWREGVERIRSARQASGTGDIGQR